MSIEHLQTPLHRMRPIGDLPDQPAKRTASGDIDFEYYFERAGCLRSRTWMDAVQSIGRALLQATGLSSRSAPVSPMPHSLPCR